jgi:hypothetical protein
LRNDDAFVKVITPGWIVALSAGAHAEALAAAPKVAKAAVVSRTTSLRRSLIGYLPG